MIGIMLTKVFSSASYARQNIKMPVKISFIAMGLNIVFGLVLISFLSGSCYGNFYLVIS